MALISWNWILSRSCVVPSMALNDSLFWYGTIGGSLGYAFYIYLETYRDTKYDFLWKKFTCSLFLFCLVGNILANAFFLSLSIRGFEIPRFAVCIDLLMLLFGVFIDYLMMRFTVYIDIFKQPFQTAALMCQCRQQTTGS